MGSESLIRVSQQQVWILCWCVQFLSAPQIFQPLGRQVHSTTTRGKGHRAIARRGLQSRRQRHPAVSRGGPPGGVGSTPEVGRAKCIPEHTSGWLLAEHTAVRLESQKRQNDISHICVQPLQCYPSVIVLSSYCPSLFKNWSSRSSL